MDHLRMVKWTPVLVALLFLAPFTATVLASEVAIVGEVNDNYQIVSNGQIYEIADTPAGNELAENHISEKVRVTGNLEERDDMKIITVSGYQLMAE